MVNTLQRRWGTAPSLYTSRAQSSSDGTEQLSNNDIHRDYPDADDFNYDDDFYDPDNRPTMSSFSDLRYENPTQSFAEKSSPGIVPREHLWHTEQKRVTGSTLTAVAYLNDQIKTGAYGSGVCNVTGMMEFSFETEKCKIPVGLLDSVKTCKGALVAIPLVIRFRKGPGHLNMLIFNKLTSPIEVERFEPHGMSEAHQTWTDISRDSRGIIDSQTQLDQMIQRCIKQELKVPLKYRPPSEVCPRVGPQTKAAKVTGELGFCQTFAVMYADLRLRNPHLSAEEVVQSILSYSPEQLRDIVQSYSRKFDREAKVESETDKYLSMGRATADEAKAVFPRTMDFLLGALKKQYDKNNTDLMFAVMEDLSRIRYGLSGKLEQPYDAQYDTKLLRAVEDDGLEEFIESDRARNHLAKSPLVSKYLHRYGVEISDALVNTMSEEASFLYFFEQLLSSYHMLSADAEITLAIKEVLDLNDLPKWKQKDEVAKLNALTMARQGNLYYISMIWAIPDLQRDTSVMAMKDQYLAKVHANTVNDEDKTAVYNNYMDTMNLGLMLTPTEKEQTFSRVRQTYPMIGKYVKNLTSLPVFLSDDAIFWLQPMEDLLEIYDNLGAGREAALVVAELQERTTSKDIRESLSEKWQKRKSDLYYLVKLTSIPNIMNKLRTMAELKRTYLYKIQADTWSKSDADELLNAYVHVTLEM